MTEMIEIDSNAALSDFITKVKGFHDAILHEAVLLHPGYVDDSQQMWGDADLPCARLIFQSQLDDVIGVELDLEGVSRFELNARRELELEAEIRKGEIVLYLTGVDGSDVCEIRASKARYRMLGREFLGDGYRLIRENTPASCVREERNNSSI